MRDATVLKGFLLSVFALAWVAAFAAAVLGLAPVRDAAILLALVVLALVLFATTGLSHGTPAASAAEAQDRAPAAQEDPAETRFDRLELFEVVEEEEPVDPEPRAVAAPPVVVVPATMDRPARIPDVRDLPMRPFRVAPESAPLPEWARPDGGPVLHGDAPRPAEAVTKGVCGGCGARLTLSARRPLRATCPRCGRSKVLN